MNKQFLVILLVAILASPAFAGVQGGLPTPVVAQNPGGAGAGRDWGDPVKWDQGEFRLDGYAGASWLDYDTPSDALTADDFQCSGLASERYITDLEFPGFSYYGDIYIDAFRVQFYTDVPAAPGSQSHPGSLLYSYDVGPAGVDGIGWQPITFVHTNGADTTAGYKINLPEAEWFDQGLTPRVLWLSIQGVMVSDGFFDAWYWGFRDVNYHFNDDAAFASDYFAYAPYASWADDTTALPNLYYGPIPAGWQTLDTAFRLSARPEPTTLVLLGLGGLLLRRRR